jgi:hypothetical protein
MSFVNEETNGSYPFSNGLNGLNGLIGLNRLAHLWYQRSPNSAYFRDSRLELAIIYHPVV